MRSRPAESRRLALLSKQMSKKRKGKEKIKQYTPLGQAKCLQTSLEQPFRTTAPVIVFW
jgi:hypothetical protein